MDNRKPNTKCKICNKAIYKRPFEIESYGSNLYCSRLCMYSDRQIIYICKVCNITFRAKSTKQIYCSKKCSGYATRNRTGTKKGFRKSKNYTEEKLNLLKQKFNFDSCMVDECNYNRCYDIHRFIEGKNGGKYIIGNMFAICPNHHAEYHRGLITFEKINDCKLKIINYGNEVHIS